MHAQRYGNAVRAGIAKYSMFRICRKRRHGAAMAKAFYPLWLGVQGAFPLPHEFGTNSSVLQLCRAAQVQEIKQASAAKLLGATNPKGGTMSYAILRFSKMKGGSSGAIEAHHERTKEKYASNPDVDAARAYLNYHLVKPNQPYGAEVERRIQQAGCRVRKDSVKYVDTIITSGPEFFEGKTPEEIRAFFGTALQFMNRRVGRQNIFTATVHMDERTPHMHLCFVPLTKDKRLCASEILGNRKKLCEWQDGFHAYMTERFPSLQRGKSAAITGRKHQPVQLYKQATKLDGQWQQIKTVLDSMNRLNTPAKKEELAYKLERWLPAAASFHRHVASMEEEKTWLNEQLRAANKGQAEKDKQLWDRQMELATLQSLFQSAQRTNKKNADLLAAIPKDVLKDLAQSNPEIKRILQGRGFGQSRSR